MFSVGDKVVHRVHGAGIITGKRERQLTKTPHRYFVIEMVGPHSTLMVPIDKAEQCLRSVSKTATLRRLLMDKLAGQPSQLPKDYRERAAQIENKLKSGETRKWIEVVRDLTHRREQGRKSQIDRRLLDRAMHVLAGELALAQGIDPEKAEIHIASVVQSRHELQDQQADTSGWLQALRQRVTESFTKGKIQATADSR
jgi:CarD family transcriptional regulator